MNKRLLLGYDIGSSSIKASLLDADTGDIVASACSPESEMSIDSPQSGWAEQHPETWWKHVVISTHLMLKEIALLKYEIAGIGIAYQMHGLVMVDKNRNVIHPSIIWCDSRAVDIGNKAFMELGEDFCLNNYLNSPGNFTASKLKWVKENRPDLYSKIYKFMLPGDFIAMKLTGGIKTTISGLSEGIFWNFKTKSIAGELVRHYDLDSAMIPDVVPTFGFQGNLSASAASELGLKAGIPVAYRAGDQPNNALSLNVLKPGEIAATAGTSGVIYGISDKNLSDNASRVNTFAHVNYSVESPTNGVLLCINGTGIQYRWLKQAIFGDAYSYSQLNDMASHIAIGSDGLFCFPFGNGAERMLRNNNVTAGFSGIDFNLHTKGHLVRAAQEGIAFAFNYGLNIMIAMGVSVKTVRAGNANLFQSDIFVDAFVNTCGVTVQIYNTDGSQGSARGAGIGVGIYKSPNDAFNTVKVIKEYSPEKHTTEKYAKVYEQWKGSAMQYFGKEF